jgi:hypothetical protein
VIDELDINPAEINEDLCAPKASSSYGEDGMKNEHRASRHHSLLDGFTKIPHAYTHHDT